MGSDGAPVTFTVQRDVKGGIGVQCARAHSLPQVTIQELTPAWKDGTAMLSGLAVGDEILAVDGIPHSRTAAQPTAGCRPLAAAAFWNFRPHARVLTCCIRTNVLYTTTNHASDCWSCALVVAGVDVQRMEVSAIAV